MVSEELFSLSEMLGNENAVVRAGKGSPEVRALGSSVNFSPIVFIGDGRKKTKQNM